MKNEKKFKTLFIITLISFCGLMLCLSFLITYLVFRGINNNWTWIPCVCEHKEQIVIRNDTNKSDYKLLQYHIEKDNNYVK